MADINRDRRVLFDSNSLYQYSDLVFSFRHQATIQAVDLDPADVITFEILLIESGTPDELCGCFMQPGQLPHVTGFETLKCYDCGPSGSGSDPVVLTADNPVVVLNAPQNTVIRAKYSGPGLGTSKVWATLETDTTHLLPGQSGCMEECCIPDPDSWQNTGETRCNHTSGMVEAREINNCGDTRWNPERPITWAETGEYRCSNFVDGLNTYTVTRQEVDDCGNFRWTATEQVEWDDTDDARCNRTTGDVEKRQVTLCGDSRWVPDGTVEWDDTGDTRCDEASGTAEKKQVNQCGDFRWVADGTINWDDTGEIRCDEATDTAEKKQVNQCGGYQWVPAGALEWDDTGDTRCENHVIEKKQVNQCGGLRWLPTAEPCGYVPTIPLPCGGSAFAPGQQPPDATVPLEDCDGTIIGYIYPDPREDANIPVTEDCAGCGDSGSVLGYASRVQIPVCDDGKDHVVFDDYLGVFIKNWPEIDPCEFIASVSENALTCINHKLVVNISDDDNNCLELRDDGLYVACTINCEGMKAMFGATMNELEAAFTDMSVPSTGGVITSWSWSFGDGGTSTQQDPNHTYTTAGIYNVVLTVVDDQGCSDTTTKVVVAQTGCDGIAAGFTYVKNFLDVDFTDASTPSNSATSIVSWRWDFGDGGSSLLENPSYSYSAAGTYTVTLIVTDDQGCSATISKQLNVEEQHSCAGIEASFAHSGNQLVQQFNDTSTPSAGATITDWTWNFGDGTPVSTAQNPTHTYTAGGTYTVTLTVKDSEGCFDSTSVQIGPLKDCSGISATASETHTNLAYDFTGAATPSTSGTSIATWEWDFGDGSPVSNLQNPSYTYSSTGVYYVVLTVTDDVGCVTSDVLSINTTGNCEGILASTTHSYADPTLTVDATNSTPSTAGASIVSYDWDWGDGTPHGSGVTTSHTYSPGGSYTVVLTVTDDIGCVATTTFQSDSTLQCAGINAYFTYAEGPGQHEYLFDATSAAPSTGGTIVTYDWDFDGASIQGPVGDGTATPSIQYQTNTSHDVVLTITDDAGCVDTYNVHIPAVSAPSGCDVEILGYEILPPYHGGPSAIRVNYRAEEQYCVGSPILFEVAIDWGNGDPPTVVTDSPAYPPNTGSVQRPFPYVDGAYDVTITLRTQSGSICGPYNCEDTLTIENVFGCDLAITGGSATTGASGEATVDITAETDCFPPDANAGATVEYDWGDGSPHTTNSAAIVDQPSGLSTITDSATHTYSANGVYVVLLKITDGCGCVTNNQIGVEITNL